MNALQAEIAEAVRLVIREEIERALAAQREPEPPFLTVNEAAKAFRVTPRTVRKWIEDGSIASERRGGRVLIPREAVR